MEIEQRPQIIAKKLWNIIKIVLNMVRKGLSKSKFMLDLQMLFKRGKILGKAIQNLMLHHHHHHYAAFTCRSNDANMSFISPKEYEFSCSNSPVYPSYYSKRKNHYRHDKRYHHDHREEENRVNYIEKGFDMLSDYGSVEASPLAMPGFGGSASTVRQLRVTDSPFPVKEMEENPQVDKDAEEFIKKFYKELKKQRRITALESPSPRHIWGR